MKEHKLKLLAGKYWVTGLIACIVVIQLFVFATAEEDNDSIDLTNDVTVMETEIQMEAEVQLGELEPEVEVAADNIYDEPVTPIADNVAAGEIAPETEEQIETEVPVETEGQIETEMPLETEEQVETEGPTAGTEESQADTETDETVEFVLETTFESMTDDVTRSETDYPEGEEQVEVVEGPPVWAVSGEVYTRGNLAIAEQYLLLSRQLEVQIQRIVKVFGVEEAPITNEQDDNLVAILGIYALMNEMTENFPYQIQIENEEDLTLFQSIYWDATRVSAKSKNGLAQKEVVVQVTKKNADELASKYKLTEEDKEWLLSVVNEENIELVETLINKSILGTLSDEEFEKVISQIPEGISPQRRAVLLAALSLEGKVEYFWGGKSEQVGWDERFGQDQTVLSAGSTTTGNVRSFGLDCSGFVTWAFINGAGDQQAVSYIGHGTTGQCRNSYDISMSEVQPGDLLFANTPEASGINHIGIVVSVDDDGVIQVVHCSSSYNNVVVTGTRGFSYARRPYIYDENER